MKHYIAEVVFAKEMDWKSPRLTVDGIATKREKILLIRRKHQPYKNTWALPGGFVEYGETTEHAVMREVAEESGLTTKIIKLQGVYSNPNRDPRGHTISIVYILDIIGGILRCGDDASEAKFFDIKQLPELAFDHAMIINDFHRGNKEHVLS